MILYELGWLASNIALICWVVILFCAFKDEMWKGVLALVCIFYLIYYGFTELKHPQRKPLAVSLVAGAIIGRVCFLLGSH